MEFTAENLDAAGRWGVGASRWYRPVMAGLAIGLLVIPALRLGVTLRSEASGLLGVDQRLYFDAALRWFQGGPYFEPWQLEGSHPLSGGEILYPPVILWLLVPFAHLPPALWWAVPMALTASAFARLRPAPWTWPVMAWLFVSSSAALDAYWLGQPTIWLPAALSWGLIRGGWAVFVLIKPSLFPFALAGVTRRGWWLALAAFAVLSIPFGVMWLDWFRAISYTSGGVLYSLGQAALLCIPVIGWLGSTSRPRSRAT